MSKPSKKRDMGSFGRFLRSNGGNIGLIFSLSVVPMVLMGGIAIDYARDMMIRGRMTAVADAAALAATTPAMFQEDSGTAQTAAINMFQAQAALVKGANINYSSGNCSTTSPGLCVTVTDTTVTDTKSRVVTVTAAVSVNNYFGNPMLENHPQTSFTVTSAANASTAPNINFYLLLDSSPSMELPATTAGINSLYTASGCALACHKSDLNNSELSKTFVGLGKYDSYTYAENNGITLRIDNVRDAAESVIAEANFIMDNHNKGAPASQQIAYQMAAYTFSDSAMRVLPLTPTTDANALPPGPGQLSPMQIPVSAIMPPLMADNGDLAPPTPSCTNNLTATPPVICNPGTYTYPTSVSGSGTPTYKTVTLTQSTSNDDTGTNFANALATVNAAMAPPGSGTNNAGDTPQEVLLIVTDGVDDFTMYNGSYCNTSQVFSYSNQYGSFYRCQQPVNTALCSTIKARGILIAVLYTTYYPVTSNSWYNSTVAPFMSSVATNLQSCASSQDLFAEVSTGGDITAALNQLFVNAVGAVAHLTK